MKSFFDRHIVLSFVLTVITCFLLEVLVVKIPPSAIMENSQKSALYYRSVGLHPQILSGRINTRKNHNGDSILLNLMYQQNPEHPVRSAILVPYFDQASMDAITDCMASTFGEVEANAYHFRYWHGSMVWLKPLLCRMDITGIYRLYGIIIIGFTLGFFIWCLTKRKYREGSSYLLAFILIGGCVTISCTEYANIMILMMAMIPLFLVYGKRGEKELLTLCVIDGALTCFIDFLTVETITITIPLVILLFLENIHLKFGSVKNQFIKTIKALLGWGISYAGMFAVKWILAAAVIGMEGIRDSLMRTGKHMTGCQLEALYYNILMLFPWTEDTPVWIQTTSVMVFCALMIFIIYRLWKRKEISMLILFLIPYVRFGVVGSHSYTHYYYTYRAQMISVLIIVYVLWGLINENKRKKKVGELDYE